jgi:hypothetical protein
VLFLTETPEYEFLKQRIREFNIDWPLLLFNPDPNRALRSVPYAEWQVRGKPIAFLINPQGVIAGCGAGPTNISELLDLLEFYSAQQKPQPPPGLRCSWNLDEMPYLKLELEVYSPQRKPLDVEVDYRFLDLSFDDEGNLTEVNRVCPVEDGPEVCFTVGFDDISEQRWRVAFNAQDPATLQDYEGLEFVVSVRVPGSENWRDGQGLWVHQGGEVTFEYPESFRERAWSTVGPMQKR